MDYFPPNIKFIITSRHIEQVLSKFKDLNVIQLSTFDIENTNDIIQYIRRTSGLTESEINLLTQVSRGNFLFMKLYLHSCKEYNNCDFKNIPDSLEKIFQMNFERIFDTESNLFQELRPILEILCSTTKPMSEEHIFEVANISSENRRKIESMIGNELGHFLNFTNGYLSLLHKSIADFLTCRSRKHERFFVHKETGHALIGTYLLKLKFSEIDIIDAAYHVAMSKNDKLQSILLLQVKKDTKLNIVSYPQKAIMDFNSDDTIYFVLVKRLNDIDLDTYICIF
ncbi:unnamed protein product [Mytilus edulis]|uniref:TANC1/2-like winged helix domain-containing protein n=1 Tax=Mytilus edulis TaxID=6550 RepID=A0A8S3S5A4_MYTED|nr:unnamed protein product [Mytilus edulis]